MLFFIFIFNLKLKKIFLDVLGLHCYMWATGCSELVAVHGLLAAAAPLVVEHGL